MLPVADPILQLQNGNHFGENLTVREKIVRLELAMKSSEGFLGEDPFPLRHWFADGMYGREIWLPKDSLIIGKIHRHNHLNFVLGDVSVLSEDGSCRLQGYNTLISSPHTKRVVYAHIDTLWTTIHTNPTNTRDLDEIEDFVIAKSYHELGLYDPAMKILEGETS
jgi:hypothetical protein